MKTSAKLGLLARSAAAAAAVGEVVAAAVACNDPQAIELAVIADLALSHVQERAADLLEDEAELELDPLDEQAVA